MLNAQEAIEADRNVPLECENYLKARDDILNEFRKFLAHTYASELPASLEGKLWEKAWIDGEASGGLIEVESCYIHHAKFAKTVADAIRAEDLDLRMNYK